MLYFSYHFAVLLTDVHNCDKTNIYLRDLSVLLYLWRFKRIVRRELNVKEKYASFVY